VHSMAGPVWVMTSQRLEDAGFSLKIQADNTEVEGFELRDETFVTTLAWEESLNLGWLMLDRAKHGEKGLSMRLDVPRKKEDNGSLVGAIYGKEWNVVSKRLVLVTEKVFSQVVNSNLEVRTSVSINPRTGAAEEGALFTYEAIPRAAWLVMDIVVDDYREGDKPWSNGPIIHQAGKEIKINNDLKKEIIWHDNDPAMPPIYPDPNNPGQYLQENGKVLGWYSPFDVVVAGFEPVSLLGVGGMGTRGFGRIRVLSNWGVES